MKTFLSVPHGCQAQQLAKAMASLGLDPHILFGWSLKKEDLRTLYID